MRITVKDFITELKRLHPDSYVEFRKYFENDVMCKCGIRITGSVCHEAEFERADQQGCMALIKLTSS